MNEITWVRKAGQEVADELMPSQQEADKPETTEEAKNKVKKKTKGIGVEG